MASCGDDEVGGVDVYENQVRPKRSTKPASCNGDDEPIGSHNCQGYIAPSHRAFPKRPKTSGVAVIVCSGDLAIAYGRHRGASCCDITSWPSKHTVKNTTRRFSECFKPYRLLRDRGDQAPRNSPWCMTPLRHQSVRVTHRCLVARDRRHTQQKKSVIPAKVVDMGRRFWVTP